MNKIFRDTIYGYITLEKKYIRLIDEPLFQRLARIRQGVCKYVYPCANHTRFEHTLGVVHVASSICDSIIRNEVTPRKAAKFVERNKHNVILAALCHDIGHAPFSHIGEAFFDKDHLIAEICRLRRLSPKEKQHVESVAPHELMSGLMILKNRKIKKILKDNRANSNLIFDMICGNYESPKDAPKNCLIQILHSSMDADRIDYVLRDNISSGAELVVVDIHRLINSYLVHKSVLRLDHRASSSVANFVYGRNTIYEWIVNHNKNILVSGVIGAYIDHLLQKEQKRNMRVKGLKEGIKFSDYFTYKGIVDHKIDDIDVLNVLKHNKDKDDRTRLFHDHIFERKHFKSLWKSPLEFERIFSSKGGAKSKVLGAFCSSNRTRFNRLLDLEKLIKDKYRKLNAKNTETLFAFMCESRCYEELPADHPCNKINMYSSNKGIGDYDFTTAFKGYMPKHIKLYPYVYIKDSLYKKYKQPIIDYLRYL